MDNIGVYSTSAKNSASTATNVNRLRGVLRFVESVEKLLKI